MKISPTSDANTRLRMVKAASELFHKQGVRATSPDDIIDASRTGKGQFYHYFKSKEGIVHSVLESHLEAIKTGSAPIGEVVPLAYRLANELWHDSWLSDWHSR